MLNETEKRGLEKGMIVLWLIWGAIFVSLLIYILVANMLVEEIKQASMEDFDLPLMRNILIAVGVLEIFIIQLLRRYMLPKDNTSPSRKLQSSSTDSGLVKIMAVYTKATVITLALAESIGIFGLVLFFLGDSFQVLYLFIAVSAAVMFYYSPKRDELEAFITDRGLKFE
jgi:hypothetical protein